MFRLLPLLAIAAALPVLAADPRPGDARCTVLQTHTPAGKLVHSAPVTRCTPGDRAAAQRSRPAPAASVPAAQRGGGTG